MRTMTKRSTALAATGLAVASVAGTAWAAWTLNGSGDAQARAGSATALSVTSAGLADGGLTPGNATTVLLTVRNDNPFPVRIDRIELDDLRSGKAGCDAQDNIDVVDTAPLPNEPERTLPAGAVGKPATAVIEWAGPLRMKANPADACQDAPFTFTVRLDAASAAR